jgi:CheY-like chemotaxis protein
MQKILIFEGICRWNGYIKKMLREEGYCVQTTQTLLTLNSLLQYFRPDLVLIGLGAQPDSGWDLFRQLKAENAGLPVLVYHVVNAAAVEEMKSAVMEALRESKMKYAETRPFEVSGNSFAEEYPAFQIKEAWPWVYEMLFNRPIPTGTAPLKAV